MKKVGILTFHAVMNYGAVLQAYALKNFVDSIGYETHVVDFRRKEFKKAQYASGIKGLINRVYDFVYRKDINHSFKKFNSFILDELNTTRIFSSNEYDSLSTELSSYYAFLCGSDQIWNPNKAMHPAHFLEFANKHQKKIAYAPSFGVSYFPEEKKNRLIEGIREINYLSVRERSGQKIIKEVTGRDSQVVLDPVFLLEDSHWEKISSKFSFDDPYILCYILGEEDSTEINGILKRLKKELGYKIVRITTKGVSLINADITLRNVGPKDFISLYKNASFIVARSFHGTAFSIIFKKPFYSFLHKGTSSRVSNLLDSIGLNDRIISTENVGVDITTSIDYSSVYKKLQLSKELSKNYLINSLHD